MSKLLKVVLLSGVLVGLLGCTTLSNRHTINSLELEIVDLEGELEYVYFTLEACDAYFRQHMGCANEPDVKSLERSNE